MRRKHNRITNYYKDKAGNEIIETQTYYTQPENDWEFDEDQKLSYNNPVFAELLKRQGKKIEDLDTGWVPQHKIGEEPEEEEDEIEEEDDEFDEEEEVDEDELFKAAPPKKEEAPKKEETSDDEPVTFKFGGKKSKEEPAPAKVEADTPDLGLSGLEAMFGPSSTPIDTTQPAPSSPAQPNFGSPAQPNMGPAQPNFGQPSNRERIGAALNQIPGQRPQIKLNIDHTTADQPMAPKTTIKLNIKPKNPTQQ